VWYLIAWTSVLVRVLFFPHQSTLDKGSFGIGTELGDVSGLKVTICCVLLFIDLSTLEVVAFGHEAFQFPDHCRILRELGPEYKAHTNLFHVPTYGLEAVPPTRFE